MLQIDQVDQNDQHWKVQFLITAHGKQQGGELIALESTHRAELRFKDDDDITNGQIISRWKAESEVVLNCPRPLMEEVTDQFGLSNVPLPDNWELPNSQRQSYRYQVAGPGRAGLAAWYL